MQSYDLVQELPGQKLHMAPDTNGRPADVAICGRHNHRTSAWQRPLLVEASCICRNCLRVREARQKSKTKKEQQHAN